MTLSSLLKIIKNNPNYSPKRSFSWFKKNLQNLTTLNTDRLVRNATFTKIILGNMYLYAYDPKTKDKLPYWDKYPLVIPFNMDEKGFIGLNLHYLEPRLRLILLSKLDQFSKINKNEEKIMVLQWEFINSVSNFPEVKPCVKRYLWNHVQSKFLKIPSEDWIIVSQLPTHSFQKATDKEVWRESRKQL